MLIKFLLGLLFLSSFYTAVVIAEISPPPPPPLSLSLRLSVGALQLITGKMMSPGHNNPGVSTVAQLLLDKVVKPLRMLNLNDYEHMILKQIILFNPGEWFDTVSVSVFSFFGGGGGGGGSTYAPINAYLCVYTAPFALD